MTQTTPTPPQSSRAAFIFLALSLAAGLIALVIFLAQGDDSPEESGPATIIEGNFTGGGTAINPPRDLPDFTFPANTGEMLSLSDLRGRYVLVYFGYTHCPDFCPQTLLDFSTVKSDLGDAADRVVFVFISVDPLRDTPPVMDAYVRRYDPEFIGLTGETEEFERIRSEFGVLAEFPLGTDGDYPVDHTISKFLIDPEGRLIRIFSYGISAAIIAEEIHALF